MNTCDHCAFRCGDWCEHFKQRLLPGQAACEFYSGKEATEAALRRQEAAGVMEIPTSKQNAS